MLKKVCIPYEFLVDATQCDAWDTLAYLVFLKSKFSKRVYYNYTGSRIGGILRLSPTTALKHINRMFKMGWVYQKDGHLFIQSLSAYKASSLVMVPLKEKKLSQIVHLKGLIIRNNISKQGKKIEKKGEAVRQSGRKLTMKMYNYMRKNGLKTLPEIQINNRTTLSNKKIGEIFGISKRSASNLQVQMNKEGIISSQPCFERIHKFNGEQRPHSFMYRNWYPVQRVANTILSTTLLY